MTTIAQRRCLHHAEREAAARCPECGNFFCRECISEHDGRVLCAACLHRTTAPPARRAGRFEGPLLLAQSLAAAAVIWFFFFLVGQALLSVPATFHEGTIWPSEAGK